MTTFFFILILVLFPLRSANAASDFRNQFAVLDDGELHLPGGASDVALFISIAKQFGYEWVIGEPYAFAKASAAVDAGLKVMYNSNNNKAAKWIRFNNPCKDGTNPGACDSAGFAEPTKLSIGAGYLNITQPLLDSLDLDTSLCMNSGFLAGALTVGKLYDESAAVKGDAAFRYRIYKTDPRPVIIFTPNLRSTPGINAVVAAELRTFDIHVAQTSKPNLYAGLYYDEMRQPDDTAPRGNPTCANPINNTAGRNASFDAGRKIFTQQFKAALIAKVGAANWGGMSGNPYTMQNYDPEQGTPAIAFDLLYNESSGGDDCKTQALVTANHPTGCGTQDTTAFGAVPPSVVQLGLYPTNTTPGPIYLGDNYPGALAILGRGAVSGGPSGISQWGGWFIGPLTDTYTQTPIYLLRAIPTWDNLRGATSRTWNEGSKTYNSSNSHMDPNIAYGRHRDYDINRKLFVTRVTNNPSVVGLQANEKVVDAKCTNFYFLETGTCVTGYFTQSGNTVSLGANVVNSDGYVLYVHRAPTVLNAKVLAADQVDVCWNADDQGTIPMAGTSLTGWTFVVAGVQKTPTGPPTITGLRCFHFTFANNTITTSVQTVTVAYDATVGNVTAGTLTINGGPKIAALSISPAITATNNLGGGNGGNPQLATTKYQWQSNVGGAATAPLYNTLNAQLVPSAGAQARLIVKIRNTVNSHVTVPFPLYYQVDPADPTVQTAAVPVTDDCTAPVCYTPALGIGSLIPGVELLASDETANIDCGVIQSFNSIPFVTMSGSAGAGSEAECIYALKFKDTLTQGQNIYFYVREAGGNPLNTYPNAANMPRARIVDPRSDRVSGMVTGGTWR